MSQKKVVEIFTEGGGVEKYRPLSERLPEFLKTYPPDQFRVIVEAKETLSAKPALARLYEAAIQAGKRPEDVGLPPVPLGVLFTASLLDKEGNTVATASAYRFRISEYKDWEKTETAARQRLLAALGFGGQILDEDEQGDMTDQRLKVRTTSQTDTVAAETPEPVAPSPSPADSKAEDSEPKEEPKPEKTSEVPPAWLRQIEHQAKLKGKKVPTVKTLEEARMALKELLAA